MMTRLTSLLALAALVASSAPADAKCAMGHLAPRVLTKQAFAGSGIVVATEQVDYDVEDKGDAMQPTWQLEVGGAKSAPKIDMLAPGLAVYRLPAAGGDASLVAGTKVIAKVTLLRGQPKQLVAPKVKSIVHNKTIGRRSSAFTTVTLDGPPPENMVALVLADAKGKARSFGMVVDAGAVQLDVYAHSRCGVVPNDTIESKIGDTVTLFWVDASGRVSPATAAIKVTGKAPVVNE
jgi:hypothetical protein